MEERGIQLRRALPYLLGLMALLLMLIPQLALHSLGQLTERAVLMGLLVYLAASRSARQGILFALIVGAFAWLLDIEEGTMLVFFVAAGSVMALFVGRLRGPVPARVACGWLAGAAVLVGCLTGMMLWRKGGGLPEALRFGLLSEWQTLAACLAGGLCGGLLAARKG